ncbi:unnamed protein product, partial [Closterium sp. NIES-65]
VLTLLSHHSLMRGASIREITLPDIFLYRLASTSSVNPDNQPVVMPPAMDEADVEDEWGVLQAERPCRSGGGGAQELAIQGTPRAEIAELGHWALDKMTRAYITSISVGVVMKKAGYSGFTQDYFLGRSRVEPGDELLALIAEHIFPGVDDLLNKHWAKRVEKTDTDPIKSGKIQPSSSQRFREPGFVDRHTLLDGASQGAHGKRVRRMMKVIDAVRQLRRSDGEADTEATVDALNKIAAPGIGTFADAFTVLNADAVATYAGQGKGVKGLGKTEFSKLRVACAFVARGLKPETWVADLFPDTWVEQMKKTLADLARENGAGQLPPTNKSTKRKKTA